MRHAAATMLGFALSVGLMFPVEQAKAEDVLKAYAHQPDLAYAWRVRASEPLFGGQLTELIVTSQRWKDTLWKHQVFVYRPDGVAADADSALLVIGGGTWRDRYEQPRDRPLAQRLPREAALVARSAKQLGGLLIVVKQVPFQPIFGNRREDAAIAYSFKQALEREDPSWPLLLPMVKSVVRTMDAVSEYAGETWETNLRRFTLPGASKRGWTTYLTGAVDDRVMAIAPMVFDILHFEPQLSHQRKAWGDYSRNIGDYTGGADAAGHRGSVPIPPSADDAEADRVGDQRRVLAAGRDEPVLG